MILNAWNNQIETKVEPCGVGSVGFYRAANGGSSLIWNNGGPISNRDWAPSLCLAKGALGWIWWEQCDGTPGQRWVALYPDPMAPVPGNPPRSPSPPPLPPSPPPPPPAQQLSLSSVAPSASPAVIASLAAFAAALRDNSRTDFFISAPAMFLSGSPLFIVRPGARVRLVGPPCTLWTRTCARISGAGRSSIITVVADSFEMANLELVDGWSFGAASGSGVNGQVRLSMAFSNVGFSRFATDHVRSL